MLSDALLDELVGAGPEVEEALLAILSDEARVDACERGEGVLLHAVHVLAARRATAAIPRLAALVVSGERNPRAYPHVVSALIGFGCAAVETCLAARDLADFEIRRRLTGILALLGVRDARILVAILELIVDLPAVGADAAAIYGDARAIPTLALVLDSDYLEADAEWRARDDRLTADAVVALAAAIEALGGTLTELQAAKVAAAEPRLLAFTDWRRGTVEPHRRAPRPARNAPCRCGSGRKYKRCHLASDHHRRGRESTSDS